MRVCSVLDRVEVTGLVLPNCNLRRKKTKVAKDLHNQLTVSKTRQEPGLALSDHCAEISFPLNLKEHRYRELPTVHKPAHPSIKAQGDH